MDELQLTKPPLRPRERLMYELLYAAKAEAYSTQEPGAFEQWKRIRKIVRAGRRRKRH